MPDHFISVHARSADRFRRAFLLMGAAALLSGSSQALPGSDLSFEDRVAAQAAIERVYHAHRTGNGLPFEEAVSRATLERKVRRYLAGWDEIEKRLGAARTEEMLQAEMDRIRQRTRFPDRLQEIYAALGEDPELFRECFARSILVGRLSSGTREMRSTASAAPVSQPSGAMETVTAETGCTAGDAWTTLVGDTPIARSSHVSVWTGSEMIVWGGKVNAGSRYDPLTDTWEHLSTLNAPQTRDVATAVWTGGQMIVWGGASSGEFLQTGGRYDPGSDTWQPTTTSGAPSGRAHHTSVWTGSEMIIWGGSGGSGALGDGGRYHPATDSWTPVNQGGAPAGRIRHSAIWTGDKMIIWAGSNGPRLNDGGKYDPDLDQWLPLSTLGAPPARESHVAVWTGSRMLVWGGAANEVPSYTNTGGVYDPASDTWTATSTTNAPAPRWDARGVWTGDRLFVWGGTASGIGEVATGGNYDPASNEWQSVSSIGAPEERTLHTIVWADDRAIVWGGTRSGVSLDTGGRYYPQADSWLPTASSGAPTARTGHAAVWTGSEMLVWGGFVPGGGRFDPVSDSWQPMPDTGAPTAQGVYPTAVWTGQEMIVWGGDSSALEGEGGRYDPAGEAWTLTSTIDAPSSREWHSAVWTGTEMIIWGGHDGGVGSVRTGGRYDPATDTWQPMSDAPIGGRSFHVALWGGGRMTILGGANGSSVYADGAVYDPATDSWLTYWGAPSRKGQTAIWTGTEWILWGGKDENGAFVSDGFRYDPLTTSFTGVVSNVDAPSPRDSHTAVWAGDRMLIWGGSGPASPEDLLDTGGAYDPASNTWQPLSTEGAPLARKGHTAVWTGTQMLIWGGSVFPVIPLNDGGSYIPPPDPDGDSDGVADCIDNCPTLSNSGQDDADEDGVGDLCDCDPGDPAVYLDPPEVTGLILAADGSTISWDSLAAAGGPGTEHLLLRGGVGEYPVGTGISEICLEPGMTGSVAQDPGLPPLGTGFWYLVRGSNSCGEGTYGVDSLGQVRSSLVCP